MNQLDSPVDFACSEYDLTIHIYWQFVWTFIHGKYQEKNFQILNQSKTNQSAIICMKQREKKWNIKLWNLFLGEAFFRKIFAGHYREDFFLPRVIKSVVFSHLGLFQKSLKFSKNPFLWSFGIDLARKLYLNVKQFRFRPDA